MNTAKLKRTLGFTSATSIGLGAMLGAGIFVFPGLAGGKAGFAAIISFLIGGIIALSVAACTSELATAMPTSGGGYYFVSRTFGNFLGTVVGIAQWIGLIFACAFYLASFGEYALYMLEELNIQWTGKANLFSFCFTLILLLINILGSKKVGQLQNLMVISLTVILILMFSYGIIDYFEFEKKPNMLAENASNGAYSVLSTTALIFTAYLGFAQIANVGAEVKNPNKNLPRSLIWSVVIAMSLYAFIMFTCTTIFPQEELKGYGEMATIEVARKMLGNTGAIIVLFAGVLAALSSANSSMISASRSVYAVSKDKFISKTASKINKRFGTPHVALILITVPILFILKQSKIEVFAEVASFLHLIIYAGICLSVLKLRTIKPNWYIPTFRVPFVKIIAGLGALSCISLIFFMQKLSIIISLGVLISSILYYFIYVRRKEITLTNPNPPHVDLQVINNQEILIPVDISEENKKLPISILKAFSISAILLLGFKETPEQTEAEQSEKEFSEEGKQKLQRITNQMKDISYNIDSKLLFGNKIMLQIKQIIDNGQFQIILALKAHSTLNKIVVPIYDLSQVNTKLSTLIHSLQHQLQTKILIFTNKDKDHSNEVKLKKAIERVLGNVNIAIQDYEVVRQEKLTSNAVIENVTKHHANSRDLIIWSEIETDQREAFLTLILKKESKNITSPIIMILNKEIDK